MEALAARLTYLFISISIIYSLFIANILIVVATFKDKNRVSNC